MSFIDTMADNDWSEADIKNRTEAMIAMEFPPVDYAILSRKVQGQAQGYVLTAEEQASLDRYKALSFEAGAAADAARADMALLRLAWAQEQSPTADAPQQVLDLVKLRADARPPVVVEST